jgi:hypothetical protein
MRHVYITWERKHNDRYWCSENPLEVPLHCPKELSCVLLQVRQNQKAHVIRRKKKNKLATLLSVRSGTIHQRINRREQNILLFHAGKCHSPHSKLLNGCPRWTRRTLDNSGMWPHRSIDWNPWVLLSETLKYKFHINNPRCWKDNIRRASATIWR